MEKTLWHPVLAAADLMQSPVAMTLLGQAVVLWRDEQGLAHAWADQCPHRGAQLSRGQVVNNMLECPYHGWRFDTQGQCKLVPAQPQWVPPAGHCANTFEASEAYGLIWVKLMPANHPLPAFEWEDDASLSKVLCGPYRVETSAPRLVENFLDMAHFGFVHEGWLGDRAHTAMPAYEVQEHANGIVVPDSRVMQPRGFSGVETPTEVSYRYEVRAPYYCLLVKAGAGRMNSIGMFICPVNDEKSICWFRMAGFEGEPAELRAFQDTIFAQDKPVVESQRPKRLPIGISDLHRELHGPLDRVSSAYRRYLSRLGVQTGVC